jgi:sphingolipid delta-4 desaturase
MRDSGYTVTDQPNPHVRRARQIMRAHPEVKDLFGTYPATAAFIVGVVGLQLGVAYLLKDAGWLAVVACAWLVGAVASHALFVLIHDAAHDLIFSGRAWNKIMGILCNVGQAAPTAMSFRAFHLVHHSHLDEYDYDGDLAFEAEARFVGSSPLRKVLWFVVFPVTQAFRPMRLKKPFLDSWLVINILAIVATDYLVWSTCGTTGLVYLLLSSLLGVGFHPLGARWIQEHYSFNSGQETYSYYGWINPVAFNIGYHNEHHDLVKVPWVHLPRIKAIAPEFYNHLYAHRSYGRLLIRFIFDRDMTLFSRTVRDRHSSEPSQEYGMRDAA